MQLVSASIWTHVAVSISYDSNHDATGNSSMFTIYLRVAFGHKSGFIDITSVMFILLSIHPSTTYDFFLFRSFLPFKSIIFY